MVLNPPGLDASRAVLLRPISQIRRMWHHCNATSCVRQRVFGVACRISTHCFAINQRVSEVWLCVSWPLDKACSRHGWQPHGYQQIYTRECDLQGFPEIAYHQALFSSMTQTYWYIWTVSLDQKASFERYKWLANTDIEKKQKTKKHD